MTCSSRLPALLLSGLALGFASNSAALAQTTSPNVLLIIADDMGLDASPCHDVGAPTRAAMPTLSALCDEGLVFENAYTAPMCSPTRATIMTGRYGFRTGVGTAVGMRSSGGLDTAETSLFTYLDAHTPEDYSHAVIGKWHLATNQYGGAEHPVLMGVDHYAGLLAGTLDDYSSWPRTQDGVTTQVDGYVTSVFTDEAIDWIDDQGDNPWFLWLAHVAPHLPLHLPPADLHSQVDLTGTQDDIEARPVDYYMATLEAMDSEIGRLLDSMEPEVREDTVVLFIGDNGTPAQTIQTPFERQRAKASLFEGGTHVPLIVAGAGVTRQGQREDALVNSTDLFATIAQLAGVSDASGVEDSVSFAPLLSDDQAGHDRTYAYTEHFGQIGAAGNPRRAQQFGWAIRDARWKYIALDNGNRYLFDLQSDPYESANLFNEAGLGTSAGAALAQLQTMAAELREGVE